MILIAVTNVPQITEMCILLYSVPNQTIRSYIASMGNNNRYRP